VVVMTLRNEMINSALCVKSWQVLVQSNSYWGPELENEITNIQVSHKKVDGIDK